MQDVVEVFDSRLNTLSQLIELATSYFGNDDFMSFRLIDDMAPLGTQVAFTCNQPSNFVQWLSGIDVTGFEPELSTASAASQLISDVREKLLDVDLAAAVMPADKTLDFGDRYAELSGTEYVRDFLMPNFYFHFVTAYDIQRANGLEIGKANYMSHLLGRVKEK